MTIATLRRRISGFTLLEVLVVVAVFAVLGVMAFGGLNAVMRQREQTGQVLERLREIQHAIRVMTVDIYQITPRPIREEIGDTRQPAVLAEPRSEYLLQLTRAGWSNPRGLPRSTLQRVAYRLEEDKLLRQHWQVLDRTLANIPIETELLTGVEEIAIRFMDNTREWHDSWPPGVGAGGGVALMQRPVAIEITVQLKDWGPIRRIVEVIS